MSQTRPRPLRRRIENRLLRWQARLDSSATDRAAPWTAAAILFAWLVTMALARNQSLDTGADLGTFTQAAWLITGGDAPVVSLRETHLLADQASFAFYPLAELTHILPTIPTLLIVQSALLAVGVVPVWRIARQVADLRPGASATLMFAYALYPPMHAVNLADFHPASIALPALLGGALFGLTDRWLPFSACVVIAVTARADMALVVAGLGVLMVLEGKRRAGGLTIGFGLGYMLIALIGFQPYYSDGAFVHLDAFSAYGSSPLGVAWGLLTDPLQAVSDITTEDNFILMVTLLAPVFFLPLMAPRYVLPVIPLLGLYFIANVADGRAARPEHAVAVTAFVMLATIFAVHRIGERSIERINVDRRLLGALILASLVFFARDSPSSPYQKPWEWGGRDATDAARLAAAEVVDVGAAVRASDSLLPELAERRELYQLDTEGNPHVRRAAADVDFIVIDDGAAPDWTDDDRRLFQEGLAELEFESAFDQEGIEVFARK